jgi:hypothetical protein
MKINKDDSDRSTWYDELGQISRIRLAVFGILSRDRVRYQRYNSVYSLLSQVSEILEEITAQNSEILEVKVPVCVRINDEQGCEYEAYKSPYGRRDSSQYQKGDRLTIKEESDDGIAAFDVDGSLIFIPKSELSCFDRVEEGIDD